MDPLEQQFRDIDAADRIGRADLERTIAGSPGHATSVARARQVFPEWRLGQTHMNVLRLQRPDLYAEVMATEADCYYRDDKVPALLRWLDVHSEL